MNDISKDAWKTSAQWSDKEKENIQQHKQT